MVQTILKTGTAIEDPDGSEWTDITEDTNSLVPILPKTGTAMDRSDWTDITEDTNSLVPILHKPGTAMDGRD